MQLFSFREETCPREILTKNGRIRPKAQNFENCFQISYLLSNYNLKFPKLSSVLLNPKLD